MHRAAIAVVQLFTQVCLVIRFWVVRSLSFPCKVEIYNRVHKFPRSVNCLLEYSLARGDTCQISTELSNWCRDHVPPLLGRYRLFLISSSQRQATFCRNLLSRKLMIKTKPCHCAAASCPHTRSFSINGVNTRPPWCLLWWSGMPDWKACLSLGDVWAERKMFGRRRAFGRHFRVCEDIWEIISNDCFFPNL